MTANYTQCRYLRRSGEQCTGEAVDEDGEILLCTKHLAAAYKLFHDAAAGTRKHGVAEAG